MNATEKWLPVVGWEGLYEVSDLGRVRSLDRLDARGNRRTGKLLAQSTLTCGHRLVKLCRLGLHTTFQVHRLMLTAFVGACPPGMEACHRNDVPDDNRLVNLRWGTRSENQRDSVRNGTHYFAARTQCPNGHQYNEVNTYNTPDSRRDCRACRQRASQRRRARKAA